MTIAPIDGGFGPFAPAPAAPKESGTPGWVKPVMIGAGAVAGIGGLALAIKGSGPWRIAGGIAAVLAGAALLTGCSPGNDSAATGSSPDEVVDNILKYYDHSGNGQIDYDNPSGLPKDDERLRVQVRDQHETTTDWDPNDEDFLPFGNPYGDSHTTRWSERRLVSGAKIFTAANENGDKVVTRAELLDLVKQYDDFGDNKLGRKEMDAFREDNPEEFDEWTRIGR